MKWADLIKETISPPVFMLDLLESIRNFLVVVGGEIEVVRV